MHVLIGYTFVADTITDDPVSAGYVYCRARPVEMRELEVLYLQCDITVVGRYILVFMEGVNILKMCEVEAYQEQGTITETSFTLSV